MGIRVLVVQHGEKVQASGDPSLTESGRTQAQQVAAHLSQQVEVQSIWSSPLARAQQTAQPIADAFGLVIQTDDRLRERMNWERSEHGSITDFLTEWRQASQDRAYVPTLGDSSNAAAARFIEALADIEQCSELGAVAVVVTHGGITVDTLRTALGDGALHRANPQLIPDGVPCGAITSLMVTAGQVSVVSLPGTEHLVATSQHRPA